MKVKDFVVSESKGGQLGGLNEFVGKSWLETTLRKMGRWMVQGHEQFLLMKTEARDSDYESIITLKNGTK